MTQLGSIHLGVYSPRPKACSQHHAGALAACCPFVPAPCLATCTWQALREGGLSAGPGSGNCPPYLVCPHSSHNTDPHTHRVLGGCNLFIEKPVWDMVR